MKRTFITLFFAAVMVAGVVAQAPSGEIVKATEAPVLDGEIDAIWSTANEYDIDLPFQTEVPTLGASGETTWKALWMPEGIYILLKVTDDAFYPHYAVTPAGNNWEYDKPEIYFDVNYILQDGVGAGTAGSGHYQVAPGFTDGKNDGTLFEETNGTKYAFKVTGTNYVNEYFVPFSLLKDKDGIGIDLTGNIGFDVTIIDRDPGDAARKRAVWANVGALNESWSNMDDCGIITFLGAEAGIDIESISLTGGTITTDNGTLQIVATILPENATNKVLLWKVEAITGMASIDANGLLTAIADGDVKVIASATDGSYEEAEVVVTISGQQTTMWELNVIKNGDMAVLDANGRAQFWGGWTDASPAHTVVDGVSVHTPLATADVWRYQFVQENLTALPNVDYTYSFKAWADAPRPFNTDFEDIAGNNYNRYGATTDPRSGNGRSDWAFDITTEPTWYTFDVNFDQIQPNTVQKVAFFIGTNATTTYIDSVLLVTTEQYLNAVEGPKQVSKANIYPNPMDASNILHVVLPGANSRITIFDSVGRKVEEVMEPGSMARIDVSRYTRGVYFVRVNNEPALKFIK